MQAEGAIGLRQRRGGKRAQQVGGIHGGLFGCRVVVMGCLALGFWRVSVLSLLFVIGGFVDRI